MHAVYFPAYLRTILEITWLCSTVVWWKMLQRKDAIFKQLAFPLLEINRYSAQAQHCRWKVAIPSSYAHYQCTAPYSLSLFLSLSLSLSLSHTHTKSAYGILFSLCLSHTHKMNIERPVLRNKTIIQCPVLSLSFSHSLTHTHTHTLKISIERPIFTNKISIQRPVHTHTHTHHQYTAPSCSHKNTHTQSVYSVLFWNKHTQSTAPCSHTHTHSLQRPVLTHTHTQSTAPCSHTNTHSLQRPVLSHTHTPTHSLQRPVLTHNQCKFSVFLPCIPCQWQTFHTHTKRHLLCSFVYCNICLFMMVHGTIRHSERNDSNHSLNFISRQLYVLILAVCCVTQCSGLVSLTLIHCWWIQRVSRDTCNSLFNYYSHLNKHRNTNLKYRKFTLYFLLS